MTGAWRGKSLVRGDGPNGVFFTVRNTHWRELGV